MNKYVYVKNASQPIEIGYGGENDARIIAWDIAHWIADYGTGTALVVHQRPGDSTPYPCVINIVDDTVQWTVQAADVVNAGYGQVQLSYKVGEEIVARSPVYQTVIRPSLGEEGEVPDDPASGWVDQILNAAQEAKDSAQTASTSANAAAESATAASGSASSAAKSATAAETAKTSAEAAANTAAGAAAAASGSAATAGNAASTASAAAEAALNAQGAAEDAQEAAENAQGAAESAKTDAEAAAGTVQGIVDNLDGLSEAIAIRETATGEVISVSDSADYRLLGLKLYGKSVQDGTPAPEAPVEIESAGDGGDIGVKIQGKNLIYTTSVPASNGITMSKNNDGTFTLNGTVTSSNAGIYFYGDYNLSKQLLPNGSYRYKVDGLFNNDSYAIRSFDNGNSVYKPSGDVLTHSYPICQVLLILKLGNTYDNVIIKPMLVYGDDMPDEFVPGIEPQTLTYPTPNGLPGIPVESGGNYTDAKGQQWVCDEVDFGRGKHIQRVAKITLTSDMSWSTNLQWNEAAPDVFHYFVNITNKKTDTADGSNNLFCPLFECKTNNGNSLINTECVYCNYANQAVYVFLAKSRASTPDLDGFKGWINQNRPVVYYILQTPTETDLTPEQLTAYAALTMYKPNTTVTTDSDPAAGIEVNYVADTKTYIDNKLAAISEAIMIMGGNT